MGFDHDPVYYDAESFKGAPQKLRSYHEENPDAFGPPVNLEYWVTCYLDGTEPESRTDDNMWVEKPGLRAKIKGAGRGRGK